MLARARAAQREREEAAAAAAAASASSKADNSASSDDSDASDSDSDSDSSDDDDGYAPRAPLLKPVFVPKASRVTVDERQRVLDLQAEAEKRREAEEAARRDETRQLVADEIRKALQGPKEEQAAAHFSADMVDDTDGLDEDGEFQMWQLRELKRIQRDIEEREAYAKGNWKGEEKVGFVVFLCVFCVILNVL